MAKEQPTEIGIMKALEYLQYLFSRESSIIYVYMADYTTAILLFSINLWIGWNLSFCIAMYVIISTYNQVKIGNNEINKIDNEYWSKKPVFTQSFFVRKIQEHNIPVLIVLTVLSYQI